MPKKQAEGKIKAKCRKIALSHGLIFWNLEGKSVNGVPDTLCSKLTGGVLFVEFKIPKKEPTEQQWLRIWELRQEGIDAWWADSVEKWEMLVGLQPRTFSFVFPPEIKRMCELGHAG